MSDAQIRPLHPIRGNSFSMMAKSRVNQWQRAFHFWDVLTERANARQTIRYRELGQPFGVFQRIVPVTLRRIERYCLDHEIPVLNILVVGRDGAPGAGFAGWRRDELQEGKDAVLAFNWRAYGNPFSFASDGSTREELVRQLVADPARAEDVYARTKVRGGVQMLFRDAVLQAYGGRCAFSGSAIRDALDAAHLLPWRECSPAQRLDVRNGIALTAWHHRVFDAGQLSIGDDYRIHVEPKLLSAAAPFDRAALADIDGKPLRLPRDPRLHPDIELIRRRNDARRTRT